MQTEWYPYKQRDLMQRHDHARAEGENGHSQAVERGLGRNPPCNTETLGFSLRPGRQPPVPLHLPVCGALLCSLS